MGSVVRKKILSIMALGAVVGLLLLPIISSIPALAGGGGPAAGGPPPEIAAKKDGDKKEEAKVEKGRDVYYKVEGIVSGPPALGYPLLMCSMIRSAKAELVAPASAPYPANCRAMS